MYNCRRTYVECKAHLTLKCVPKSNSYIEDGSMLIRAQHGRRQIEDDDIALESYQTNEINQRNQLHLKTNQNKLPKKRPKRFDFEFRCMQTHFLTTSMGSYTILIAR